ncbi:MAG TPA: hypothetical protein VK766_10940 [Cytophagaceae bacterium]|jgi:hypothetical protein|nr:hypothetical protein [Cytophagaceae bacterium]
MKKEYVVRGYLLSQHVTPFYRIAVKTRERAVSLAEILLEERFHYVTIINHNSSEEIIEMKKELIWQK